jgi:GNAT superfamily N-acetyltransferase
MVPNLTIRKARLTDMPQVHALVKELAVYENGEAELWLKAKHYDDYFAQSLFECDVALHEETIIAMIIYYPTFSTWKGPMLHLEDFIVTEAFRRKGVGKQLLDHFLKMAKERKVSLAKWEVLDWNTPAINFYKKYDVIFDKEWWNVKIVFDRKPDL